MAQALLFGLGEERGNARRRDTDNGTGNDAEEHDESEDVRKKGGERPEGKQQHASNGSSGEMNIESAVTIVYKSLRLAGPSVSWIWSEKSIADRGQLHGDVLISKISTQNPSKRTACIHDTEEIECAEATLAMQASRTVGNVLFDSNALPLRPVFEVEEDGVEPKENEAHGSDEPPVWMSVEGALVDPNFVLEPLLWDAEDQGGIRYRTKECYEGCPANQDCQVADCSGEPISCDEELEHDGID